MRILAGDITTVGALCGEDAGERVTIHFDLRALSIARTGRKKGHINGNHGVLMRSLSDLVEQAIDRFQPDVFASHENAARGDGSRLLFKLQGVVEIICAERCVRFGPTRRKPGNSRSATAAWTSCVQQLPFRSSSASTSAA